jgi:sRNA-binding protein
LNAARTNRLIEHHARDSQYPSLKNVLDQLWQNTWHQSHKDDYLQAIQQGINWVTLQQIMALSMDENTSPHSQAQLYGFLKSKHKSLAKSRQHKTFNQAAATAIEQFLKKPEPATTAKPKAIPPGSPIGMN